MVALPILQREELAAMRLRAQEALSAAQQLHTSDSTPTAAEGSGFQLLGEGGTVAEGQPLLFYSVRAQQQFGPEPPLLVGPRLEDDPLPLGSDAVGRLLGQVNSVEAGRVHGWACFKGALGTDLAITVYVDGVRVGQAQALLPTQTSAVRRLCHMDTLALAGAQQEQQAVMRGGEGGVGFVVPLPPLPEGLHVVSCRQCCCVWSCTEF